MSLNNQLIEQLKQQALDYSLQTNRTTDVDKVRTLFESIYNLKQKKLKNVILLDSPRQVQDKANELLRKGKKEVQSNISHNSLAPIVQCYKYLLSEHKDKVNEDYKNIVENFDCYFYAVALTDTVIISEYPTSIKVDGQHRLHNLNGASMEFKDGFKTFHFSGNLVPSELAETPINMVTREMLAGIQNADIRRDFIQRVGMQQLTRILNYKTIDQSLGYRLIEFKVVEETHRYLMMVNPSMSDDFFLFDEDIKELFYENMDKNPKWVVHVEGVDDKCSSVVDALKFRNANISERKGFKIVLKNNDNFIPNQLT